MTKKIYILPIVIFLLPSTAICGESLTTQEQKYIETLSPIQADIYTALKVVAAKHGVEIKNVVNVAINYFLNSPPLLFACGKGGVSTLGNQVYIFNNENVNKISFGNSTDWIGLGSDYRELAVIEDGNVKTSFQVNSKDSKLTFVLFEPDKISYFNYGQLTGGQYLRNCK